MDIDAQIAALEATKRAMVKDATEAGKAARAEILLQFQWRVTWKDEHTMEVECRHSPDCEAALLAWKEEHPLATQPLPEFKWRGMKHLLFGTKLVSAWGGSVVLNIPREFGTDWHELTQEQADAFRAGIVPEELRKGW